MQTKNSFNSNQNLNLNMEDQMDNQDEMDQISTIALLIDDLSSEDPSAKLHSI